MGASHTNNFSYYKLEDSTPKKSFFSRFFTKKTFPSKSESKQDDSKKILSNLSKAVKNLEEFIQGEYYTQSRRDRYEWLFGNRNNTDSSGTWLMFRSYISKFETATKACIENIIERPGLKEKIENLQQNINEFQERNKLQRIERQIERLITITKSFLNYLNPNQVYQPPRN